MTRRNQRCQVRHRPAADEQAAGGVGKSANSREPAYHSELNCRGGRTTEPGPVENIESSGKRIRHRADEIIRPGDKCEKARMIDMQIIWKNIALQLSQQLVEVAPAFGRITGE